MPIKLLAKFKFGITSELNFATNKLFTNRLVAVFFFCARHLAVQVALTLFVNSHLPIFLHYALWRCLLAWLCARPIQIHARTSKSIHIRIPFVMNEWILLRPLIVIAQKQSAEKQAFARIYAYGWLMLVEHSLQACLLMFRLSMKTLSWKYAR